MTGNVNNAEVIMTTIKKCNCKNEYQDKKYGKQRRVHNSKDDKTRKNWRCTVCNEER